MKMITGLNSALTPPRGKVHSITPHHHEKSNYADQTHEHIANTNQSKNNKREPPENAKKSLNDRSSKRQNSNPTPRKAPKPTKVEEPEEIMDANDPEQAHRIKQRQKTITKGKNTAGYSRYRSMVPLEERKEKSLSTPTSPNPYVQMSAKRWQGCVRAWRISLHQYDPPELVQTLQPPTILTEEDSSSTTDMQESPEKVVEENNVVDAVFTDCKTPSSQADSSSTKQTPSPDCSIIIRDVGQEEDVSPCISVLSRATPKSEAKRSGQKADARRELETLFTEAKTPEKKQKTKRSTLRTGAKGWGDDDSSDEEDDELL